MRARLQSRSRDLRGGTGPRIAMNLTRLTQHAAYRQLHIGGKTYEASPTKTWGSRDRSWGVRVVWANAIPRERRALMCRRSSGLWSPTNFADTCTHFDVMEMRRFAMAQFGRISKGDIGSAPTVIPSIEFNIVIEKDPSRAQSGNQIARCLVVGITVDLEVLYNFTCSIRIFHPMLGHGSTSGRGEHVRIIQTGRCE